MKKTRSLSFLSALLCAVAMGSVSQSASAADIVCQDGWDVFQCGNGTDNFPCVFNAGTPDAYQVSCTDYQSTFQSSADAYCHDRGGLANPPIVAGGPICEPAEDETIRDEDQDIDEAPPRRSVGAALTAPAVRGIPALYGVLENSSLPSVTS